MVNSTERAEQLALVARLKSEYLELPDAPTPDLIDHARYVAYLKAAKNSRPRMSRSLRYTTSSNVITSGRAWPPSTV